MNKALEPDGLLAWKGVGSFQHRMSVMLEEESRRWTPPTAEVWVCVLRETEVHSLPGEVEVAWGNGRTLCSSGAARPSFPPSPWALAVEC